MCVCLAEVLCAALLSTVPAVPQGDAQSSDSLSRKTEIACWLVSLARARLKDLHKDLSTVPYRALAKLHAVS